MCVECRQTRCPASCPNAPWSDPKPVYYCIMCGCGIYDGDEYYDLYEAYCEECIGKARRTADAVLEDW